jgi:UDPglucose--hexose-1-phosphate uridylyltransferase
VFKNQGQRAGASLAHLHTQLVALPSIPPIVESEMRRAEDEVRMGRSCPYCRLLEKELSCGKRIVCDESEYVAFCPFASVQPFEVWLQPKQHVAAFEQTPSEGFERLAFVLHRLVARMESVVPEAAYHLLVRTAPWRSEMSRACHWRIELLPRGTPLAGFELATGMFINSLAPERAARKLRSV